jgi:hypothetical protein
MIANRLEDEPTPEKFLQIAAVRDAEPTQYRLETVIAGNGRWRMQIDACSVSGDSRCLNEDSFAVIARTAELVCGVFDGTTSLRPVKALDQLGLTGARFASVFLRHSLDLLQPELSARDVLCELNARMRRINSQLDGVDPHDINTVPASSGTIARFDARTGIMQVGHVYDSWCVAYYRDGRSELVTVDRNQRFDQTVFDLMAKLAREQSRTPREVRQQAAVQNELVASRAIKSNTPDGSGVGLLNGDANMCRYIQERALPLEELSAVLLGTDGLVPQGWTVQDAADRRRMHELIIADGIPSLIDAKRRSEEADPDWWNIRDKHSDDATGVFVQVEPLPTTPSRC